MNDTLHSSKSCNDQQEKVAEKCPICLQIFNSKSKSYSSKCFHSFCFECLLEWTKIKDSCPLCKQKFERIIFDIKSNFEFKEYYLEKEAENAAVQDQPPVQIIAYTLPSSGSRISSSNQNNNMINLNIHLEAASRTIVTRSKASWELNKEQAPTEFRILVYLKGWYVNPSQMQYDFQVSNIDLELNDNNDKKSSDNSAKNSSDVMTCIGYKMVNKFRMTKPEWFKKNPACTHRLINFINRDLKSLEYVLPQNSTYRFRNYLTDNIMSLLKTYPIESNEFLKELKNYIKPSKYAKHFRHELNAFARSICHDLIEYDAKCVYYSSLDKMPIELQLMNNQTENIIPFKSIPVSLARYKLILDKNSHETDKIHQIIRYETINQFLNNNFINNNNNNDNLNFEQDYNDSDSSDSDQSSFCEILTPPPKTPPIEITLEDGTDDENLNNSSICSSSSTDVSLDDESNTNESKDNNRRSRSRSISISRKRSISISKSRSRSKSHKKKKKHDSSSSKKKKASSKHRRRSHKKTKSSSRKHDKKSRTRSREKSNSEDDDDEIDQINNRDKRIVMDTQNESDTRIVLAAEDSSSSSIGHRKERTSSHSSRSNHRHHSKSKRKIKKKKSSKKHSSSRREKKYKD
jgi:hypothetical protein